LTLAMLTGQLYDLEEVILLFQHVDDERYFKLLDYRGLKDQLYDFEEVISPFHHIHSNKHF
jgi:hypothetical protein